MRTLIDWWRFGIFQLHFRAEELESACVSSKFGPIRHVSPNSTAGMKTSFLLAVIALLALVSLGSAFDYFMFVQRYVLAVP